MCYFNSQSEFCWRSLKMHFVSPWCDPSRLTGRKNTSKCVIYTDCSCALCFHCTRLSSVKPPVKIEHTTRNIKTPGWPFSACTWLGFGGERARWPHLAAFSDFPGQSGRFRLSLWYRPDMLVSKWNAKRQNVFFFFFPPANRNVLWVS